jgi:hypothetical protein
VVIPAQQAAMTFTADVIDDHLLDGSQQVTVTASASSFEDVVTTIEITDYETWQNPVDRYDVNQDGHVSPLDVLRVIERLQREGPHALPINPDPVDAPSPFLDVNGDLQLSALDVDTFVSHFNEVSLAILRAREAAAAENQQVMAKLFSEDLVLLSSPQAVLISRSDHVNSTVKDVPASRQPSRSVVQVVSSDPQVSFRPAAPVEALLLEVRPANETIESGKWEWGELEEILDLLLPGELA